MTTSTELAVLERAALEPSRPLGADEIRAQVNVIQQVMRGVMKKDVHYGTIPGTPKPTLYKPGAEKILSTFRIVIDPIIEDLSLSDEVRYRVTAKAYSSSGIYLGAACGECSSREEKYHWRSMVHIKEWDATPDDRKRIKYTRKGDEIKQVRTNPADVANTILKMASKRGLVAVTLQVTAASDIFAQDIEDLPEELRRELVRETYMEDDREPIAEPQESAPKGDSPEAQGIGLRITGYKIAKETKDWTLFAFTTSDGAEHTTFSASVFEVVKKAHAEKAPVSLETETDSKNREQVILVEVLS